ncbi:MAG: hypothetical protein ACK56F_26060, partial [bacterium]
MVSSVLAPAATVPCRAPLAPTPPVREPRTGGATVSSLIAPAAAAGPTASRAATTRAVQEKV